MPRHWVLKHDAFRATRRSRRIDDVAEVGRRQLGVFGQPICRHRGSGLAVPVQPQYRRLDLTVDLVRERTFGNEGTSTRVAQNVSDPLQREAGVDRNITGASLENAEHGREHSPRFLHVECDQVAAGYTALLQCSCNLIGVAFKLRIGQRLIAEADCGVICTQRHLALKIFVQERPDLLLPASAIRDICMRGLHITLQQQAMRMRG